MKPVLAAAAGFTLSLGMFAGGAVLATYTLTAQPVAEAAGPAQDVAALWTAEPKTIDPDNQAFERIAAAPLPPEPETAGTAEAAQGEEITIASADPMAWPDIEAAGDGIDGSTAGSSLAAQAQTRPKQEPASVQISSAHAQWCADRYRSYRIETNSYTAYSGEQRTCVSPHSGAAGTQVARAEPATMTAGASATSTSGRHVEMASRHVQSCFERYRSYRPEDNSYQPYGGGPRRQCR